MTTSDLGRLTEEWRERLRLKDWNINLGVVDFLGSYGETHWDKYKNAQIELCSPKTLPPQLVGCDDVETTLIHELLHLHAAKLTKNIEPASPEDDALEEMIEIVAQAFAVLRRELAEARKPKKRKNAKKRTTGQLLPTVKDTGSKDSSKAGKAKVTRRAPKAVRTYQRLWYKPKAEVHRRSLRYQVRRVAPLSSA